MNLEDGASEGLSNDGWGQKILDFPSIADSIPGERTDITLVILGPNLFCDAKQHSMLL